MSVCVYARDKRKSDSHTFCLFFVAFKDLKLNPTRELLCLSFPLSIDSSFHQVPIIGELPRLITWKDKDMSPL